MEKQLLQETVSTLDKNMQLLQEASEIIQELKVLLRQKDRTIESYRQTILDHIKG